MNEDITIPAQSVTVPSQDVIANIPAAQIVYQNVWLNQVAAISSMAVFSPPSPGLYRLTATVYGFGPTYGGNYSVPAVVAGLNFSCSFSGGYSHGATPSSLSSANSCVFSGELGDTVNLSTSIVGDWGNDCNYSVYITIEQLQ